MVQACMSKDLKGMSLAESHTLCPGSQGGIRPMVISMMLVSLNHLEECLPGLGVQLPAPL